MAPLHDSLTISPLAISGPCYEPSNCEPSNLHLAMAEYEAIFTSSKTALAPVDYSIRIPPRTMKKHCSACDTTFLATGPTGFAGPSAICDLCLFRGDPQLGMIIALIAVVRSFARSPKSLFESFFQSLLELGAFARLYEAFAARFGAPRPFIPPDDAPDDAISSGAISPDVISPDVISPDVISPDTAS